MSSPAAAAAMQTAVTIETRVTLRADHPLGIPRVTVPNRNGHEFARRLATLFAL
jgi:hypothetical protein